MINLCTTYCAPTHPTLPEIQKTPHCASYGDAHTILKYVILHQLGTMEVQLMLQKVHYIWNKAHHGFVLNLWYALLKLNFHFFQTYFLKLKKIGWFEQRHRQIDKHFVSVSSIIFCTWQRHIVTLTHLIYVKHTVHPPTQLHLGCKNKDPTWRPAGHTPR